MNELNNNQQRILDYIKAFIVEFGWSPDRKDIQAGTGIGIDTIKKEVPALVKLKYLRRVKKNELRVN